VSVSGVDPVARSTGRDGSWKRLLIYAVPAVLLIVVSISAYLTLFSGKAAPPPPTVPPAVTRSAFPDRPMIAVLPFENLGEPEDEYFADGITEEITSRLAAVDGLAVISRTSAMQYKDSRPSLPEIGRELGVDYVLEGTVRWQRSSTGPSRVRVTPQLIQVSEDTHLWAERYDAVLEDIFDVQSDIARQVSEQLGIALLEPQLQSMDARPTGNLEAYDAFLRGNDFFNRGKELNSGREIGFAIQQYETAVRLDPAFSLAQANLSLAHSWLYFQHEDRSEARLSMAKQAAERAIEFDADLPEAHFALGFLFFVGDKARERAIEEFETVLKSQPSNAEVYEAISFVQLELGQWDEGRISMMKAMELNPRLGRLACKAGGRAFGLRDFDEALLQHDRSIRLTPDRPCPYYCKLNIYLNRDGNTVNARRVLEQLPPGLDLEGNPAINQTWVEMDMIDGKYQEALERLSSGSSDAYEFQNYYLPKTLLAAQIYGLQGRPDLERENFESARDLLEDKVREFPDDPRIRGSLGIAYAGLGRREEAIREGRKAVELLDGSRDEQFGYRVKDLAQIFAMVADNDGALEQMEMLLTNPSFVSAPLLGIEPAWRGVRNDPRIRALLQKHLSSKVENPPVPHP
jgi:serine/threonine-protein kinase